eukprot:maker-scaffold_6-snap-gene-18.39-mRNA-1 protein AED:0.12 eAED:0.17 QI:0/0/0/1/1/1/2/0/1290
MHIKRLKVVGFKSYGKEVILEDFSDGLNAIIGRNGSGKSNLFRAIQFVLCDAEYSKLGDDKRKALLHEDSGDMAHYAMVEVTFDNSSGRFARVSTEEVVLNRTISLQNDSLRLNGKAIKRTELENLLKASGFASENPYYIVEQGKVNRLCLMSDAQRMDLLKKIAGASDFERNRIKIEKEHDEHKEDLQRVEEKISAMDRKLSQLKKEKKELAQFQKLEQKRLALKYLLNEEEFGRSNKNIQALSEEEFEIREFLKDNNLELVSFEEKKAELGEKIPATDQQLKENQIAKDTLVKRLQEARKEEGALKVRTQDLEETKQRNNEKLIELREELKEVESSESDLQNEIALENPVLDSLVAKETELNAQKDKLEVVINGLQEKKGRTQQFRNERQRNKHLKKEISSLEESCRLMEKHIEVAQEQLAGATRSLEELELKRKQGDQILIAKRQELAEVDAQILKERNKHIDQSNKRKESRATVQRLKKEKTKIDDTLSILRKKFNNSIGVRKSITIKAVLEIIGEMSTKKIGKVYGPVYSLLQVRGSIEDKASVFKALEQTVGPQLSKVVCENGATASSIIKLMKQRRLPPLTFVNLDFLGKRFHKKSLDGRNPVLKGLDKLLNHAEFGNKCKSLGQLVEFVDQGLETALKPLLLSLFGKIVYYSGDNMEHVAEFCSQEGIKAKLVDQHGSIMEQTGFASGGSSSSSNNKLAMLEKMKKLENKATKVSKEIDEEGRLLDKYSQEIMEIQNSKDDLVISRKELLAELDSNFGLEYKKQLNTSISETTRASDKAKTQIDNYRARLARLQEQVVALSAEKEKPFNKSLSDNEVEELLSTQGKLKDIIVELERAQEKTREQKLKCTNLEYELTLTRSESKAVLEEKINKTQRENFELESGLSRGNELERLDDLHEIALKSAEELAEAELTIDKLLQLQEYHKQEDEKVSEEITKLHKRITGEEQRLARLEAKLDLEKKKKEGYRKQREHMSIVARRFDERLNKLSRSELMNQLKRVSKDLDRFPNVNQKALTQFEASSTEKQNLDERKQKLEESLEKIDSYIDKVERKKHLDVHKTFRRVRTNFAKVFSELVPEGWGELQMLTHEGEKGLKDESDDSNLDLSDTDDSDQETGINIDNYIGVAPKVCFRQGQGNSSGAGEKRMSQLSGGQRALVAICLILAIQRVDPAPFYLFDELDQALDEKYREAVANLLHKQSKGEVEGDDLFEPVPVQFIVTSFRPELVQASDKIFGVNFGGEVGSVKDLEHKTGLEFIKTINEEQEAIENQENRARRTLEGQIEE